MNKLLYNIVLILMTLFIIYLIFLNYLEVSENFASIEEGGAQNIGNPNIWYEAVKGNDLEDPAVVVKKQYEEDLAEYLYKNKEQEPFTNNSKQTSFSDFLYSKFFGDKEGFSTFSVGGAQDFDDDVYKHFNNGQATVNYNYDYTPFHMSKPADPGSYRKPRQSWGRSRWWARRRRRYYNDKVNDARRRWDRANASYRTRLDDYNEKLKENTNTNTARQETAYANAVQAAKDRIVNDNYTVPYKNFDNARNDIEGPLEDYIKVPQTSSMRSTAIDIAKDKFDAHYLMGISTDRNDLDYDGQVWKQTIRDKYGALKITDGELDKLFEAKDATTWDNLIKWNQNIKNSKNFLETEKERVEGENQSIKDNYSTRDSKWTNTIQPRAEDLGVFFADGKLPDAHLTEVYNAFGMNLADSDSANTNITASRNLLNWDSVARTKSANDKINSIRDHQIALRIKQINDLKRAANAAQLNAEDAKNKSEQEIRQSKDDAIALNKLFQEQVAALNASIAKAKTLNDQKIAAMTKTMEDMSGPQLAINAALSGGAGQDGLTDFYTQQNKGKSDKILGQLNSTLGGMLVTNQRTTDFIKDAKMDNIRRISMESRNAYENALAQGS